MYEVQKLQRFDFREIKYALGKDGGIVTNERIMSPTLFEPNT